jgi:hypothetical protein
MVGQQSSWVHACMWSTSVVEDYRLTALYITVHIINVIKQELGVKTPFTGSKNTYDKHL